MSEHEGADYLRSYSGLLKILEAAIDGTVVIFTTLLGPYFQPQFLCGIAIYGFISAVVLMAFHLRGFIQKSDFPWCWVECINSALVGLLLLVSSTFVVTVLTKGYIITGIIGYIGVMVYSLDSIDKFRLARTPRARYVWTTPNMPE